MRIASDPYDAAHRANAVVLVTEWPEFCALEPARLAEVMSGDLLLDGRNVLPDGEVRAAGLRVIGVGW